MPLTIMGRDTCRALAPHARAAAASRATDAKSMSEKIGGDFFFLFSSFHTLRKNFFRPSWLGPTGPNYILVVGVLKT